MYEHDWLAEGVDPDDIDALTDEDIEEEMELRQYLDKAESAWLAADCRCINGHRITFSDFMDNYCIDCNQNYLPF